MRTFSFLALAAATAGVAALASMSAGAAEPGTNGQIAFHRFYGRSGVTAGIFVMNPDGTGVRQLTSPAFRTQDESPDFSPDGSNLVYTHRDSHSHGTVWRVSVNGGGSRRVDPRCPSGGCQNEEATGAVYSPDGKRIAFTRNWGPHAAHHPSEFSAIYLMSAAGKSPKPVFKTTTRNFGGVADPGWSPDGRQIVFVRSRSADRHALFIVAASGGKTRQLTPYSGHAIDRPDFSPDGNLILFRSEGKNGDGGNLYTVRAAGGGLTQLTHFGPKVSLASARFSPDGQSIVFGYDANGGNADIYTMKVDGTGLTQLTRDPGWESSPDWGPGH
jgi:Tol biopolymer transport system component